MNDYEFTFILPSFNEGVYVRETTDSILQTAGDAEVEVIVVDDHSDDFSGEDLAAAYSGDDRVQVVRGHRRLGAGGARSFGALEARGDVLVFLDAHSRMPDGWPDKLRFAIDRCGRRTLFGLPLVSLTEAVGVPGLPEAHGIYLPTPDLVDVYCHIRKNTTNPYPVMALPGGCMALTRDFYTELDGFDPGIIPPWGQECMELCIRAWMIGGEVRIIPHVVVRTLYKDASQANPGIQTKNLLYNRLRIALLYFERSRVERVLQAMRKLDWFDITLSILLYEGMETLDDREIEYRRDPEEIFEKFGILW